MSTIYTQQVYDYSLSENTANNIDKYEGREREGGQSQLTGCVL